MSWLINIFFLCHIWALYLQQVLNNIPMNPMNNDPQPNFKLCPATLSCRNLITVHFWKYISIRRKKISKCALSDEDLMRLVFWCAIVLKPLNRVKFDKILKKWHTCKIYYIFVSDFLAKTESRKSLKWPSRIWKVLKQCM